jgi:hypothetical protein
MSLERATQVRDAALRRLGWANRAMLVASLALTGVLAEITASSFDHGAQARGAAPRRHGSRPAHRASTKQATAPLRPPAEAPKPVEHEQTAPPAEEVTATPPQEEADSEPAPKAASEPPPTEEPEPVVTGAS